MRFGEIPLDQASGAILAHTVRLADGGVIKKGRVLGEAELELLARTGGDTVVAAILDPDDVDENSAAKELAAAAAGLGVRVAEPFTGRCNIVAATRGLAQVAAAAVNAFNAVDESVTMATLPTHAPVRSGVLVATVKIIPFATPRHVLDRCLQALAGSSGSSGSSGSPASSASSASQSVISVTPLSAHRVGFILTELPGTPERVLTRASDNMRIRLENLGSTLEREVRTHHDPESVTGAIRQLLDSGCAPVLVLGASAIVDRQDVIPAAVTRAGGDVHRYGMPVDPGNLVLLAECDGVPVLGVPGCARSLNPSGFDRILERVLADEPVEDISVDGMGVGGLLKEAPSRPQPRQGHQGSGQEAGGEARREARQEARQGSRPRSPAKNVGAVILAAGSSRRMGDVNKLLAPVDGRPMVAHAVESARSAGLDPIVLVTGHEAERVGAVLREGVIVVRNPDHAQGMSTSVRVGIQALPLDLDGAVVALADMPWVRAEHITALVDAFDPDEGRGICVPLHDRKRGNPVLWAARYFPRMMMIEGDVGARQLLAEFVEDVCEVPVDDDGVLRDVDTPDGLVPSPTE